MRTTSEMDDPTNLPLFEESTAHNQFTVPAPDTAPTTGEVVYPTSPAAVTTRRDRRNQEPTTRAPHQAHSSRFWQHVAQLRAAASPRLADTVSDGQRREPEQVRAIIEQIVKDHIAGLIRGDGEPWDEDYSRQIKAALFDELVGLGRLQPLVDDPEVENVAVYGHDHVLLKLANGDRAHGPPVAISDEELISNLQQLADRQGRSFAQGSPFLDLALPGKVRLHASHPHITQGVPIVNLRIHRFADATLAKLRELGELDVVLEEFLAAAVRAGKSIVVSGKRQGSGKTTLLRALAREIPPSEKIVTIETEYELYLHEDVDHPEVVALEAKPWTGEFTPDGKRSGEVTTEHLAWGSLRENADRVIVGEARSSAEVGALVDVMQHGGGSMSTIHADNARTVIDRLVDFVGQYTGSYEYASRLVSRLFHLVVFIGTDIDANGRKHRYISEVLEVQAGESNHPSGHPVFTPGADGKAVPNLAPSFIDDLVAAGFDQSLFNHHPGGLWPRAEGTA